MIKPNIVVHMMMSVDGRIDCDMTAQLKGNDTYYHALQATNAPTTLSGRVTAQSELAETGEFVSKTNESLGKESYAKNSDAAGYEVVIDTKGKLLWGDDANSNKPHLVITSEQVKKDYLDYLDERSISWIAVGKDSIDLAKAMDIIATEFGVEKLAIVGGGHIDGAFLDAGLVDDISIVIGSGVDGRANQPAVFDGLPQSRKPTPLTLKSVEKFDGNAVWLQYTVDK